MRVKGDSNNPQPLTTNRQPPTTPGMPFYQRLLLLAFLLVLIYLYGLGFLAYSLYTAIGVVLSSWIMSRRALDQIAHTRTLSRKRCNVGESVNVSLELVNNKTLPVLWVLAEDWISQRLPVEGERVKLLSLRAGQVTVLRYEVDCKYRGYHRVGPLILESGDLFGLSRKFRTGRSSDYVTVLPKVVPLTSYDIHAHRPIGEIRTELQMYEDPSRLAGVRRYVRGDSLSRIHWRATARTGTLHSRVYDPTTMIGANIILDFHADAYAGERNFERSELAVTAAISLTAFILEQKQQVGLLSNGRDALDRIREEKEESEFAADSWVRSRAAARELASEEPTSDRLRPVEIPNRRGEEQFEQLMVTLARLEITDGLRLGEMLFAEYNRLPRDAALIVITGKIDAMLADVLGEAKRSGFVVAVFIIDDDAEYQRAAARLSMLGMQCYHLRNDGDLSDLAMRTI